jgi:hypothetical protein
MRELNACLGGSSVSALGHGIDSPGNWSSTTIGLNRPLTLPLASPHHAPRAITTSPKTRMSILVRRKQSSARHMLDANFSRREALGRWQRLLDTIAMDS